MSTTTDITATGALLRVDPMSVYEPTSQLKSMAAEYAAAHRVDADLVSGSKRLLPRALLDTMKSKKQELATYLSAHSSPWEDGGWRIVKAELVAPIVNYLLRWEAEWEVLTDNLLKDWSYVRQDMETRLGIAWEESKFPTEAKMRKHLAVRSDWKPIPAVGDWRIEVPQGIINQAAQRQKELLEEQQNYVTAKVTDALEALAIKFRTWEQGTSRLHTSSVQAVKELVDLIPKLLLTPNPSLLAVCAEARRAIDATDLDELKESEAARKAVQATAEELLRKLGNPITPPPAVIAVAPAAPAVSAAPPAPEPPPAVEEEAEPEEENPFMAIELPFQEPAPKPKPVEPDSVWLADPVEMTTEQAAQELARLLNA